MNTIFTPVFPLSTFVLSCIELFFLFFALIQHLAGKHQSNTRFMLLILVFLQHNLLCSLLPNYDYNLSILFQNIIVYSSSMFLAVFYFRYLHLELDFAFGKVFTVKVLIGSLVITFLIFYVGTYLWTADPRLAQQVYIGFPSIVALYYAFQTVRLLLAHRYRKSKISHYKVLVFTGALGVVCMATMPILTIAGDEHKGWNDFPLNMSLFLAAFVYFQRYIYLTRNKFNNHAGGQVNHLSDLKNVLTNREFEIAYHLIRKELSHQDIGDMMYISRGTVSKHASNIYQKSGVKNRSAFINTFLPDKSTFSDM